MTGPWEAGRSGQRDTAEEPHLQERSCILGACTALAPESGIMRGLRSLYLFARDACSAGSLESRLRKSCAALIDLRDFTPLLNAATGRQSTPAPFPSDFRHQGDTRFTAFASSHVLARQVHNACLLSPLLG